jgi:cardiolipin synthase
VNTQTTPFTHVKDYYADLIVRLETAREAISMTYLAFEDGRWARSIADVLCRKAAQGVRVRLMVDEIGQLMDEPRRMLSNHRLLHELREDGLQVDLFRPGGHGLTQLNRLHCKICAIDGRVAYLGGSNVGDYYVDWSDTNVRLDGDFGRTFHDIYDYLRGFTSQAKPGTAALDPSDLWAGDVRLWLTVPGRHSDIRSAILRLIENARQAIYIRTWYFLPDDEILQALCAKAAEGVRVSVLLSHQTRLRPVDAANYLHAHRLASAGGQVYRYTGRYMHAKLAWNDAGEVLLGSANLDAHSMGGNFEICAWLEDANLARKLRLAFEADSQTSILQTPEVYRHRSLPGKMMTHACNLAAAWL